jgi:polysaccharide export outer membrane protein
MVPMSRYFAVILVLVAFSVGCASRNAGLQTAGNLPEAGDAQSLLDSASPPELDDDYVIGVGDRLDVVFFIHKDLTTLNLLVRDDGRITLPYVGDVPAVGFTPMRLDSTLTERFSEVLREPILSVIVRDPAAKYVYVLGQVLQAGEFRFDTKISLMQALARARGFGRGAKASHVVVIRRDGPERIVGVEVDVGSITKGKRYANDIWLRNYDIVYVPKTRLQSASEFVEIVYDVLFPPTDLMLRGWTAQVMFQQLDYLRAQNN